MKFRMTILAENNKPRRPEHTEDLVKKSAQLLLDLICSSSENEDRGTVEKVEFLDD